MSPVQPPLAALFALSSLLPAAAQVTQPSTPTRDPARLLLADFTGDGLDDAISHSPTGEIRLLENLGDPGFVDVTEERGLGDAPFATCVLLTDLDGDGLSDLILGSSDQRVWRNVGGAFVPLGVDVAHPEFDLAASTRDADGDGALDLVFVTELGMRLYRNLGNGAFDEVVLPGSVAVPSAGNPNPGTLPAHAAPAPAQSASLRLRRWLQAGGTSNPSAVTALSTVTNIVQGPTLSAAGVSAGICANTIVDQTTGQCIEASSAPTLGTLLPQSEMFNFTPQGQLGLGTTNQNGRFDIGQIGPLDGRELISFRETEGASTFYIGSGFVGSGGNNYITMSAPTLSQPIMSWRRNGDVAIGAPFPVRDLDVRGYGSFGDLVTFSNHGLSSRIADTNPTVDTAIFGSHERSSNSYAAGVYGRVSTTAGWGVFSEGNFGASGTKSFVQPHPSDASKQIQFVCLEGNESGTYFRGRTTLVGGRAVVQVPEDFRLVSESEDLTVQLTPMGKAQVWFERLDLETLVIGGDVDVEVHYTVNGVRRGYADYETIRENTGYRPTVRGEAYGTQYPDTIRELLVENGTLNADYTPNESTAATLGWTLQAHEGVSAAPSRAPVIEDEE
ncbi:MAG: VCBS repeat-containing protein [Planctomycetota bacterium]